MRKKFDKIISLGSACATRYHIDRALTTLDSSYKTDTYFFDWLWRDKGFESNLIALRDNLKLSKKYFNLKLIGKSFQPYHSKTGFYFAHQFSFSSNVKFTKEQAQEQFEDQYDDFNNKLLYLADKTLKLIRSESSNLFIFQGDDISSLQINEFFNFVGKNSQVLHLPKLDSPVAACLHERVICKPMQDKGEDWTGDHKSWDKIFFESGIF